MSSEQDSQSQDTSGGLQKAFESYTKFGKNNEGKLDGDTAKDWLKKAGIIGDKSVQIKEKDVEKSLPQSANDGGMDYNEFQQYIQEIAKEKGIDANDLNSKLASAVPTQLDERLVNLKSKVHGNN